jgi:hypothetical protein
LAGAEEARPIGAASTSLGGRMRSAG